MRQGIWQTLFVAVAGVGLLAGSVAAQPPAIPVPVPLPGAGAPAPQPAQVPGAGIPQQYVTAIPPSPAVASGTPTQPGPGAVVVQGGPGCANCSKGGIGSNIGNGPIAHTATAARGFVMQSSGGYYGGAPCGYATPCNNGCGSFKNDLGMLFGSCRSFFSPCGPESLNCGKCKTPVYGRGAQGPYTPCQYDSYGSH